jgi:hypothetical protein
VFGGSGKAKRGKKMTHLFKQIYVDEVAFEELTQSQLVDLVFTEFNHREIKELEKLQQCACKTDPWLAYRNCCEMLSDDDLWLTFADQAMNMVDCEHIWHGIVEACKVLKYPDPSSECRSYFEQLYSVSCLKLCTMYLKMKRTPSLDYLMDYIICVCKLKYKLTV